ncbi:MAG: choice-of-anchor D domain-containing protein [bacterium]|nr:choice-of-anchor D domain-containing protein [bacterium]
MLTRILTRSMFACALFAIIGTVAVTAQGPYPRIRVVEEWSSATCGPCVQATPVIDAATILDSGVVSIRYHMNFPAPNDPWNLYNPSEPQERYLYYDGSGSMSIPKATANGGPLVDPRPATQASTFNANLKNAARTSPIQITVTQNGGKIKVRVKSDIALTNHKLQVALVSRYANVPNIATILAGSPSNGEKEFHDMFHKMYPTAAGTALNIPAAGDQTFEFPASVINNDVVFPPGQQYAIAFVQSNTTKEILQGGVSADMTVMPHTFTFFTRSKLTSTVPSPYQRVGRGATSEVDVTVTNNGTAAATADGTINNTVALTQLDMSAEFSPASVTVAPGESKTVKLKVTGSANRSNFTAVELGMSASDGLAAGGGLVYYLVEGGRVVTYYGMNNAAWTLTAQAALNSSYSPDVVYMPYSDAFQNAYPATDFDAAVFAFDAAWIAIQGSVFNTIQGMEASGKGLWISGQANMYMTFEPTRNGTNTSFQPVRDWYKNTLGIDYNGFRARAQQVSGGIQVASFSVKGVAGDSIGKGITPFTANQIVQGQWQNFVTFSDIIKLTPTSKAKSWLYYSDSTAAIGGIRVVTTNGSRIVYSSLDLQSVMNATNRNNVTQEVLDWILNKAAAPAAILSLANTTLQFGQVQIGGSKDMDLTIRNTGNGPLVITDMVVAGTDFAAFEVISTGDVTIAPGASKFVPVRFTPTTVKASYIASIEFSSNSAASPTAQLRGTGVTSSVETDVASETGAIGLRLIGANPVSDATDVELRSLTNTTVTIIDQTGRTVSTIFDGAASGTQRVSLQTSTLPAGMYNVVASNGSERAILSIVVVR